MKGLKIAVIGGGSTYTPELLEGLITRKDELNVRRVVLMDIDRKRLDIVGRLAKRMVEKAELDIDVVLSTNRQAAIKGADYVVTQIRVGGNAARVRDERIPLEFGCLGQETTGPGGFMKAMRTIPVMMGIAQDIRELAPDAWLINFTNPSGLISEAVRRHGGIRILGLCNAPYGMRLRIGKILGVPMEKLELTYVGLNHLSWITDVRLEGKSVHDKIMAKAIEEANEEDKPILRSLNAIFNGYCGYYYHRDKMVEKLKKAEKTRGEQVMEIEASLLEKYKDPDLKEKPEELGKRGGAHYSDAACSLISAIENDKREFHIVNVRNGATLPELSPDATIEALCLVNASGAHPLPIGPVPSIIRGTLQAVKAYEELAVQAGVFGDRDAAVAALAIHPLVSSWDIASALFERMAEANREFLPQFYGDNG